MPLLMVLFYALFVISTYTHAVDFTLEVPKNLGSILSTNNSDLCIVAHNTQHYLEQYPADTFAVHSGVTISSDINLTRVKKTLAFICEIYQEDKKKNQRSRLSQEDFLIQHFDFIRWTPDKKNATSIAKKSQNTIKKGLLNNIPENEIFLTKYYTKLLDGSNIKTPHYNQALYALPFDEQGIDLLQAELKKDTLTRFKYTRQQVINGALLNKDLAQPLVWLTEEALHDVLLQGTGVLVVDGKTRYFNVHRNNGIAYSYDIGKREQSRYWYFIETPEIMGYGQNQQSKIAIKPQVTFAGNIAELGLGKLVMVSYQVPLSLNKGTDKESDNTKIRKQLISRMGVIADQGGAFDHNLFQLDLLVDSYRGWEDYHQANKQLPDYAAAWIMLIKEAP